MTVRQWCIISVPYIGTLVLFLGLLLLKSSPPYHRIKGFQRCACVCSWISTNTLEKQHLQCLSGVSARYLTYIHTFMLFKQHLLIFLETSDMCT